MDSITKYKKETLQATGFRYLIIQLRTWLEEQAERDREMNMAQFFQKESDQPNLHEEIQRTKITSQNENKQLE